MTSEERDAIASCAARLQRQGMTPHRAFRALKAEFPHAERDVLVNAARLPGYRRGVNPQWTEWGPSLRPAQFRFKNKEEAPE